MKKFIGIFVPISMIASVGMANAQTQPQIAASPSGMTAAKGKVVGLSDEPQSGVPVQIKGPLGETVAITDKNGTWSMYNLPAGNYQAQMVGLAKTKAAGSVQFTVKPKSFWEKIWGADQEVLWTPEMKVETAIKQD
jgi:hypothetical protein